MLTLTHTARRAAPGSLLARLGPALVLLELAATVWTLAAVAVLDEVHGDWSLGIAQRLQVGLIAVWLGVLAVSVARAGAPAPARAGVLTARARR
jgi:hypothetical protein